MKTFLFLDVDGVLNNNMRTNRVLGHTKDGALLFINDKLVNNLKYLYDKYNLNLILSSTWRIDRNSKKVIKDILANKQMIITDSTPIFPEWAALSSEEIRTMEILDYIENNIYKEDIWLAVDDLPLLLEKDHFVRTKINQGLDAKKTNNIEDIINLY